MKMAKENIDMIGEVRMSACKFKIIVNQETKSQRYGTPGLLWIAL